MTANGSPTARQATNGREDRRRKPTADPSRRSVAKVDEHRCTQIGLVGAGRTWVCIGTPFDSPLLMSEKTLNHIDSLSSLLSA